YLRETGRENDLIRTFYTSTIPEENEDTIRKILAEHKDLGGIAVLNSRGSSIAEVLKDLGREDVKLVSFDLTMRNVEFLKEGSIYALLCQHPFWQGFEAASALCRYLIQGKKPDTVLNLRSVDIVLKELVDFYKEG
nr:substrate-binding domain-containing protein [Bacteroidales bacterium]